jgi:hypothetical protein
MLPALSGSLPDSFSGKHIRLAGLDSQHHPNRVHGDDGNMPAAASRMLALPTHFSSRIL